MAVSHFLKIYERNFSEIIIYNQYTLQIKASHPFSFSKPEIQILCHALWSILERSVFICKGRSLSLPGSNVTVLLFIKIFGQVKFYLCNFYQSNCRILAKKGSTFLKSIMGTMCTARNRSDFSHYANILSKVYLAFVY